MSAFWGRTSLRFARNGINLHDATAGNSYSRIHCLLKRWKSEEKKPNAAAVEEEDEENDKPIQYTKSNVHKEWKSAYNFRVPEEAFSWPSYQYPVMALSIVALLVYFGFLREENDLDAELTKPLHERFPAFEKPMLEQAIRNAKMVNADTSELEKRLKAIS